MNATPRQSSEASGLNSGLNSYRLRALAVASAAVLAQKAEAQLVTVSFNHTLTGSGGFYFNPVDGGTDNVDGPFRFVFSSSYSFSNSNYSSTYSYGAGLKVEAYHSVAGLGPACVFFSYSGLSMGSEAGIYYFAQSSYLDDGRTYFAGFRMENQGLGMDKTYYGWLEISLAAGSATLVRSAYNSIDDGGVYLGGPAIAIPEPAHAVSLLAAGAAGIALLRRRRCEKSATVAA